jgi:hypothetical protein
MTDQKELSTVDKFLAQLGSEVAERAIAACEGDLPEMAAGDVVVGTLDAAERLLVVSFVSCLKAVRACNMKLSDLALRRQLNLPITEADEHVPRYLAERAEMMKAQHDELKDEVWRRVRRRFPIVTGGSLSIVRGYRLVARFTSVSQTEA